MQRRLVPRLARPPPSSLFPYTTLFRSHERLDHERGCDRDRGVVVRPRDRRDSPSVCRWMMDLVRDLLDAQLVDRDRKRTRLNSSHRCISYAVFCLKKKTRMYVGDGLTV